MNTDLKVADGSNATAVANFLKEQEISIDDADADKSFLFTVTGTSNSYVWAYLGSATGVGNGDSVVDANEIFLVGVNEGHDGNYTANDFTIV
ncbi:hypothetical protein [Desulfonatronovibrio magnus]|uniref:hypothetical protein n=1 Tax=Desulfonatronovibrio magnus TaxID=698827 RepID=UPI0005EB013F|nr:hypothetical protein [Desulfonatronovibrio magnus]